MPRARESGSVERPEAFGGSLPCLNRNNSNERSQNELSTHHRKTAFCLEFNVRSLSQKYGINNLGFLTLTFPRAVSKQEMQRRWNSLSTGKLRHRYRDYISVVERGARSGRLHFHLIVVCNDDIRTGSDVEAIARGQYKGANPALRREWAFLRETLPKYGFGRHELLPIKSNEQAITRYVGKYIAKHIGSRIPDDKNLRLVRYSKGARQSNNRFMFATKGSRQWRELVGSIAKECGFSDLSEFKEHFGAGWAYALQAHISSEQSAEEGADRAGKLEHPRNQPDSVDRCWLPAEFSPLPQTRPGYSGRREWRRRLQSANELALRKRFRRYVGQGPVSKLSVLLCREKKTR